MDFEPSPRCSEFKERLTAFMDEHVYPAEALYESQMRESGNPHHQPAIMEELKLRAREAGLWNMFLPDAEHGAGLSNSDYAPLAEILGRSHIASEACNCSAPDTGNMEVLHQFATPEQKDRWLTPLLEGEIRSAFAMTEPEVASSDATNIAMRIERDGEDYVLNGLKWWTSNALHPNCRIMIVMGKTQTDGPRHRQQSQILVPFDTPGVTVMRNLRVFGYDDQEGHAEVEFTDVRVPKANLMGPLNGGWPITQGSLAHERAMLWITYAYDLQRAVRALVELGKVEGADGRPRGEDATYRDAVAGFYVDAQALLAMGYRGFSKFLKGKSAPEHSLLKLYGSESLQKALLFGAESLGLDELDLDQFGPQMWREGSWAIQYLRSFGATIPGGTSEIQRNIIAERVLGLPRA